MIQYNTFYSQPCTGQDRWVVEQARRRECGTFVEIGAYDGVRHSNTLALEKVFAWSGLLVEPHPELYAQCVKNRPRAKTVQAAVSNNDSLSQTFVLGDSYSGLWNFMPHRWRDEHLARRNKLIDVQTTTLANLLEMAGQPRVIDYLSLDVEGAELAILERFFQDGAPYTFKYVTVEFRYDRYLLRQLENVMADYELAEVRAFDACFVHRGAA
jgi:FkbM family methyltransferase